MKKENKYNKIYTPQYFEQRPYLNDNMNKGHFFEYCKWLTQKIDFKTILDVGCGWSNMLSMLTHYGKVCTGADVSHYILDIVKDQYPEIEFVNDSLPNLKVLGERKFDVVTCYQVMEHIYKREIKGSLKRLCELANKYVILSIAMGEVAKKDSTHVTIMPREWWIQQMPNTVTVVDQKEMSYNNSEQEFILRVNE